MASYNRLRMLTFHTAGDWPHDRVALSQIPSSQQLPDVARRLIDEAWDAAKSQPGVHLFDGPMCRLESWSVADDGRKLHLALSRTTYKSFLGTNLRNPQLADRYGREVLANPVGVSPALETADAWLLMGRRNASVAYYPGRVHPFAGALEPRDADDVFAAVQRELAEELNFTAEDVGEVRCTGIAEDRSIRQPELIFRVNSTRTRAQIEATLDRTEHHASWAIAATAEAVDLVLGEPAALTPVAVAALLLWGRAKFGSPWFDQRATGMAWKAAKST
jgi:8-oxo-dGTP pyrophosphatase MutT (NUDIX family)